MSEYLTQQSGLSRIDGTNFQQFLEEQLVVKDDFINPQQLDSRAVRLNVDLSQGGFGVNASRPYNGDIQTLAGLSVRSVTSPGTDGGFNGGREAGGGIRGYDHMRVHNHSVEVAFDAAGMTAFNGKSVIVRWQYRNQSLAAPNWFTLHEAEFVVTDRGQARTYALNINDGCSWQGYVLNNYGRRYQVESLDGTAFPANTTCQQAEYKTVKRIGGWLPI